MSYYSGRASWVASWAPQRLYPHQEPVFTDPTATTTPSSPTSPSHHAPRVPPPLYFPGAAQLARTRTTPGRPSTNVAHSQTTTLEWAYHPTLRTGWRRFNRIGYWWRSLRKQKEDLVGNWPEKFGGRPSSEWVRRGTRLSCDNDAESGRRVSRSTSGRSVGRDSGIALSPRSTMEIQQHPLEPLFCQRVRQVSVITAAALVPTRVVLSLLEILDAVWVVVLIVALAVTKGKQERFLEVIEVALVLLIILNGTGINWIRMRRWTLAKKLRTLARDWSPLPITSSTNQGLLNNFLGEIDHEALTERMRGKDEPSLRWSMHKYEGSWWLSYRPLIKVELITPVTHSHPAPALPVSTIDIDAEPERHSVPPYEA